MLHMTVEQVLCCIIPFLEHESERISFEEYTMFVQIFSQEIKKSSQIEVLYVDSPIEENLKDSTLFDVREGTYGFHPNYLEETNTEKITHQFDLLKSNIMMADYDLSLKHSEYILSAGIQRFQEQRAELKNQKNVKTK